MKILQKQSTKKVDNTTPSRTAPNRKQTEELRYPLGQKTKLLTPKQKATMKKKATKQKRSLSTYERNVLLPVLMNGLEAKKGLASAVTAREITEKLKKHGLKINERHVCRIINHIRTNDLVVGLVGGANGYYVAINKRDLVKYEKRLKSYEDSLRKVRMSIKRQRDAMFATTSLKQVHLF